MKKSELIELLQRQNDFLHGKLEEALGSISSLASANEKLTATVDELRRQITSLEDVVKGKGAELSKEKVARNAVQCLQGSSSEKQAKSIGSTTEHPEQKTQRKRTDNGAKRKTHPEYEVEIIEVEPDGLDLNPELAMFIGTCDVVRYEMISARFIKKIFYDDGSLSAEVFGRQIMGFKGAFQCDCYSGYRNIGIGEMTGIKQLPCLQHIKRKFLDIKDSRQAQEIAKLFRFTLSL